MKRLAALATLSCACACLLAACGSEKSIRVTYRLTTETTDPEQIKALYTSAVHALQGRLAHLRQSDPQISTSVESGAMLVSMTLSGTTIADRLEAELRSPFMFRIMEQPPEGQAGDLTLGSGLSFRETGVTEQDLRGAHSATDAGRLGSLVISFTEAGHAKLGQIAQQYRGKKLALIIRKNLLSTFTVDETFGPRDMTMDKIPSPIIARNIADDINASLFVTFTRIE